MNEKDIGIEEGFYKKCAMLLDCAEHVYRPFPYRKRTRWNNRAAGNGRYEGHGLIRMYGPNNIHVMLRSPSLNKQFTSVEDALAAIKDALNA